MPTPPKPFKVLKTEKKSHRTKAELKQRQQGEEALSSGLTLEERPEVKSNSRAHKEFEHISKMLGNIQKNDAIYETVINRYCLIYAECFELEERKKLFEKLVLEAKKTFKKLTPDINIEMRAQLLVDLTNELAKITASINNIDKIIQSKRKMMLDIEKENIMTIAAALRSIPKKEEKPSNKLLEALK
jgi:phage terminase small subunit